ncbi:MAG: hypothetical protein M3Y58_01015 [Chloroflexota bacterium]|nr:hypothetical protein [Chloroflexota bacterium]
MPHEDELTLLREETETLAEFLHILQREYAHLQADFAAVLEAIGGQIAVPSTALRAPSPSQRIERTEDPATGTVTFRLRHDG